MSPTLVTQPRDGYVFVVMTGRLRDLDHAAATQAEISAAAEAAGARRLLIDNRQTEAPDDEVRASMWAWAATFDRVALVVDSEMTAVRTNMSAVATKVRVRAFHDEDSAIRWLGVDRVRGA